eukprot:TRINITY_DN4792_c0_g1_i1.p1 TRINITY_DN4792_c0_g1~~TRINITY_DN4792_c0_g1_i1.p1  ORF type:complete len:307 (+),score=35.70 TRINITY_DN4792_c0_g1_i1:119-1039(+)
MEMPSDVRAFCFRLFFDGCVEGRVNFPQFQQFFYTALESDQPHLFQFVDEYIIATMDPNSLEWSLRSHFAFLLLPGSARVIDEALDTWSRSFSDKTPHTYFNHSDNSFIMAYSTIMLNTSVMFYNETDAYNAQHFAKTSKSTLVGDKPNDEYFYTLHDSVSRNYIQQIGRTHIIGRLTRLESKFMIFSKQTECIGTVMDGYFTIYSMQNLLDEYSLEESLLLRIELNTNTCTARVSDNKVIIQTTIDGIENELNFVVDEGSKLTWLCTINWQIYYHRYQSILGVHKRNLNININHPDELLSMVTDL